MLLVTSAGNSGNSSNPYIAVPADGISVLAIGAVNSLEVLTSFSSRGPSFDGRIKPDIMAQESSSSLRSGWKYCNSNGTSFSSPIMAGMVACLWQLSSKNKSRD
jgi:subtilisin family serine protease